MRTPEEKAELAAALANTKTGSVTVVSASRGDRKPLRVGQISYWGYLHANYADGPTLTFAYETRWTEDVGGSGWRIFGACRLCGHKASAPIPVEIAEQIYKMHEGFEDADEYEKGMELVKPWLFCGVACKVVKGAISDPAP